MIASLKGSVKRFRDSLSLVFNPGKIPVFYHDIENFGDQLTPYLLGKIYQKPTINMKARRQSCLMGVGSILHFATEQTYVWGAGILDPKDFDLRDVQIDHKKILALRGQRTKEHIENHVQMEVNCPLGDPAVTLPMFFDPKVPKKKFHVGLIPHYVDYQYCQELITTNYPEDLIKLIDVRKSVETVINEILSCDYILSSSLHGLIISDTYNVPNLWVGFSEKLIGGEFKYMDYYSTTDNDDASSRAINSQAELDEVLSSLSDNCQISNYIYDKQELILVLNNVGNFL